MALNCPRDGAELEMGNEHGIEIDRCPTCKGAWYDDAELALLEQSVSDDPGHLAGTIDYAKRESEIDCPVCKTRMRAFNYRAHNLELDACVEEHGFWLDADESAKVREVMRERVSGLGRAQSAQAAWDRAKRGGGGMLGRFKDMLGGGRR